MDASSSAKIVIPTFTSLTTLGRPADTRREDATDLARAKLFDAEVAGFMPVFSPDEADVAGAFDEDALSEADAWDEHLDIDLLRIGLFRSHE